MFKLTLDFGDGAVSRPRLFESYSDLAQYLEQVPNTFGFLVNNKVTIKIESNVKQDVSIDPRTYLLN